MNVFSESLFQGTGIINGGVLGGWVAARSILTYGLRIGIRTNSVDLLDRLSEHYPPLWKANSTSKVDRMYSVKIGGAGFRKPGRSFHELFEGLERGAKSRSLSTVLEDLERRMKMYVAEMARRRVFVHAGAVGWRGRAIIIPGSSLRGKTSLVAELVRAGATYYSDEYAVLDMRGRVHSYPQPLAMRRPGSAKQKKCRAEEIGGVVGTKPLPVGLVVLSRYENDAHWHPSRLSSGMGVLDLLANTLPARRKPGTVMRTLQRAVSEATILKGVRGEADEAAALILKAIDVGEMPGQVGAGN